MLLAIALELPEDYFTKIHQYEVKSEVWLLSQTICTSIAVLRCLQDHLRYMKYSKYTEEENKKVTNWSIGHTGK